MEIKPFKGKCKIPDEKQMGYIGVRRSFSQPNNPEMTKDVHGLEDLSLNNFQYFNSNQFSIIFNKCIFGNVLVLQQK